MVANKWMQLRIQKVKWSNSSTKPLYLSEFLLKQSPRLMISTSSGHPCSLSSIGMARNTSARLAFCHPRSLFHLFFFGIAKTHFDLDQFGDAIKVLDRILSDYAGSGAAPEAVFLKGVCGYKNTHNPTPLKEAYEKLQATYPASEWTKRALPYRLLP
ncbi:MAG: hypothetical protein MZU95_11325 [Desulfomicrobium escambiense]|nr:hypothetical protein [Desulfomicrobium escambiense]